MLNNYNNLILIVAVFKFLLLHFKQLLKKNIVNPLNLSNIH